MRILITGATGFVGKTLIPYLISKGMKDLVLLVRNLDKAKTLFGNESVEMITTQSSDWMEQVKNANPDVTLHLAAFFTGRHDYENANKLAQIIHGFCEAEQLPHLDKSAMARLIEYASKLAGSHKKLSTRFDDLIKVAGEAATWAKMSRSKIVTAEFVFPNFAR